MEDIFQTPHREREAEMDLERRNKDGTDGQMVFLRPSIFKKRADRILKKGEWMIEIIRRRYDCGMGLSGK